MERVRKKITEVGGWAFLIGAVLALLFGLLDADIGGNMLWLLLILGVIVGLLNVSVREVNLFLISGAVLIVASAFGKDAMNSVRIIGSMLDALLSIFVPATIVVAVRKVFNLARSYNAGHK